MFAFAAESRQKRWYTGARLINFQKQLHYFYFYVIIFRELEYRRIKIWVV